MYQVSYEECFIEYYGYQVPNKTNNGVGICLKGKMHSFETVLGEKSAVWSKISGFVQTCEP